MRGQRLGNLETKTNAIGIRARDEPVADVCSGDAAGMGIVRLGRHAHVRGRPSGYAHGVVARGARHRRRRGRAGGVGAALPHRGCHQRHRLRSHLDSPRPGPRRACWRRAAPASPPYGSTGSKRPRASSSVRLSDSISCRRCSPPISPEPRSVPGAPKWNVLLPSSNAIGPLQKWSSCRAWAPNHPCRGPTRMLASGFAPAPTAPTK